MSTLWTPPQARTLPRSLCPHDDVRLADGRMLKYRGPFHGDEGERDGSFFVGPARMTVIASDTDTPHGRLLHVSLAYPKADPTWRDIRLVREAFYGADVDVMMVLPHDRDYANLHPHAFHLWQTPSGWGLI